MKSLLMKVKKSEKDGLKLNIKKKKKKKTKIIICHQRSTYLKKRIFQ